jgi:hypothetical protein
MTGGLIQLVAKGVQDIYLTNDPQITFFKIVYRRHTNFSTQPMSQRFSETPDFGKRVTCLISRNGDLMGKTILVIKLPAVKTLTTSTGIDAITKFAWVRKIGLALIKNIEIEIGGQVIDRHYGDWLNIWYELTYKRTNGFRQMIGDTPDLYNFTSSKDSKTLYVPLSFWFCRDNTLALPLVSLLYSDVRINLEISDLDKCYLITPTHYIYVENDIVNLKPFEYIEQVINGKTASGLFTHFDYTTKKLYYMKISNTFKFYSITDSTIYNTPSRKIELSYSDIIQDYRIYGLTSKEFVMPQFNSSIFTHSYIKPKLFLNDCYLLVTYIWVDSDERIKFADSRHDYLIEQLIYVNEKTLDSSNRGIRLDLIQPAKLIATVVQYSYLLDKNNNDHFNYTDSYKYNDNGVPTGKSLVINETIELNGVERVSFREYNYFNYYVPYTHFSHQCNEGINIYSFCLFPEKVNPSGSCNMTQIDNIELKLKLDHNIAIDNTVKSRTYQLGYNILRIINGLCSIVFTR